MRGKGLVRKRCERCGHVGLVRERQTKCRRPRFGRDSFACWGDLVSTKRSRNAEADPEVRHVQPAGDNVPGHAATLRRKPRPQDAAQASLDQAAQKVVHYTREALRVARLLASWQRKAAHYARRATMTDAEVEAERRARKEQAERRAARKVRRGIAIKGGP